MQITHNNHASSKAILPHTIPYFIQAILPRTITYFFQDILPHTIPYFFQAILPHTIACPFGAMLPHAITCPFGAMSPYLPKIKSKALACKGPYTLHFIPLLTMRRDSTLPWSPTNPFPHMATSSLSKGE
jgi:hypothetical protein